MLHDGAKNRRLEVLPVCIVLGDGDEVIAKNTPVTPGMPNSLAASCEVAPASSASRKSAVPLCITTLPGRNFSVAGLGVDSV
jgi:hypothetical protein